MQTGLKTDNFCGYNQAAAPFYWVFEPGQYENTYVVGEVGIIPNGGGPGSYVRPDVIDVSSFLLGTDNILTKCIPPVPDFAQVNDNITSRTKSIFETNTAGSLEPGSTLSPGSVPGPANALAVNNAMSGASLIKQANALVGGQISERFTNDSSVEPSARPQTHIKPGPSADLLLTKYTKALKSENNVTSIDFDRWQPNLPANPQDLRFIIEDFWPQRGGADTRNFTKSAWSNQNNSQFYDPNMCRLSLDPNMACGTYCSDVSGYSGFYNMSTGKLDANHTMGPGGSLGSHPMELNRTLQPMDFNALMPGIPPGQPNYPFIGITSQDYVAVGAAPCGPQFFHGPNYDQGACPKI